MTSEFVYIRVTFHMLLTSNQAVAYLSKTKTCVLSANFKG